MIPVIQDLLPRKKVSRMRSLLDAAECELQIGQHEQQIRNLVKMVAKAATALVADAYHAEIEATQAASIGYKSNVSGCDGRRPWKTAGANRGSYRRSTGRGRRRGSLRTTGKTKPPTCAIFGSFCMMT